MVRDDGASEVPKETTGIATALSHVVLSGLKITCISLTTGSRPWLQHAATFVAQTQGRFARNAFHKARFLAVKILNGVTPAGRSDLNSLGPVSRATGYILSSLQL